MGRTAILLGTALLLAGCGARDRCTAPAQAKQMSVADMSLDDKANALGVPPEQVPAPPKSAPSYGALVSGLNDNEAAQSRYQTYVDHKNAALGQEYCLDNEAYKARGMKDELNSIAHAVMATCHSDDEAGAEAIILKFRNCAAGNP
jgi:hypothetical protein